VDKTELESLLQRIKNGEIELEQALDILRDFPLMDLGFAQLDTHRTLRQGLPEVIFGQGKTSEQIVEIISHLSATENVVLVTKLSDETLGILKQKFPQGKIFPSAKAFLVRRENDTLAKTRKVLVLTAGTSDMPVAEETIAALEALNICYELVYDVGVAGIHRILKYNNSLKNSAVVIVIAGMEGALASIVASLTEAPVIAVPTSVGYGASFGGVAALLGMLNSCAAGITVVNIDNGFGAAYAAAKIIRRLEMK
jgi:NCAIR mutase (PurE)-related protein